MIKDRVKEATSFDDPGYIVVDIERDERVIKYFGISRAIADFVTPLDKPSREQLFATLIDASNTNIKSILENLPNDPEDGDLACATSSIRITTDHGEWRCIIISFTEFGMNSNGVHSYSVAPDEADAVLRGVMGEDYEDLPGVSDDFPAES